ncbi:YbjQ family protein [Salibaculum griseiflavum]|uniref:YbjQ family protein n=1 Tax=Salibaculum griseiflavum TaxID=1914409 RepID=UPI001C392073|nr:heavy metal-binding domain-containing protein [Salibaculum griseiflavum]
MAKCPSCGKKLGLFDDYEGGVCKACYHAAAEEKAQHVYAEQNQRDADIDAVTLTTETYPEGLKITKRIEVVTAECAFGMNIFKDLFAGVRDIVGGRSEAVQKTLRDSRRVALYELKREAYEVGANAVVGVDLDYVELVAAGNMVLLVASGTAVRIEE